MNILHYSLGLFPIRQGGLIKYSTDLAQIQSETNNVFYIYPGKLGIVDKNVAIISDGKRGNVNLYKINNALPIPLYSGISDEKIYTKSVDKRIFREFFKKENIQIVHIHSIMGLHKEFLQAAQDLNIPVVMTTHDLFGLCVNTSMYKEKTICKEKCINEECAKCSIHSHSYLKLAVGQSSIYKTLKNKKFVSGVRSYILNTHRPNDCLEKRYDANNCDYNALNDYYRSIFGLVDYFLFNSIQTETIFRERISALHGEVVMLSHKQLCDRRKHREFLKDGVLKIGFMSDATEIKGYFLLKKVVEDLYNKGFNIKLFVYNDMINDTDCIFRKGKYTYSNLEVIYDSLDLIVIPSICPETFGFVALEALSYAMPCIVSERVGAKDLIDSGINGFVLDCNEEDFKETLKNIINTPIILNSINRSICQMNVSFDFVSHSQKITNIYKTLIGACNEDIN